MFLFHVTYIDKPNGDCIKTTIIMSYARSIRTAKKFRRTLRVCKVLLLRYPRPVELIRKIIIDIRTRH